MTKQWEIINKFKAQSEKLKVEDLILLLLKNRGIVTKKQREEFFYPPDPNKLTVKDFGIDPEEFKKAVARIKKAKKTGERVIVWGDYDVDGICGAALLWESLYAYGLNTVPFIPERRAEGYGLNIARMKKLKEEDPKVGLIITVDNGIVAHEKVDIAKELGVDVIITDHHVPRETKPKAYAILHTTSICGAGVAWVLAREIKKIDDHLGLVAMATIADMVPLLGCARALTYYGLKDLCSTTRPGIRAICITSGIDQSAMGVFEISFILAPRLNAMGRLEHAMDSLRLLCTKNAVKAREMASRLSEVNTTRQQLVADTVIHAREQALLMSKDGVIVVAHETYHEGVIGLVAARLVEEFGRPVAVIAKGIDLSKGSLRSVPGFNIVGLLDSAREILVEGGGHPMAGGFTVLTQHIQMLNTTFQKHAGLFLTQDLLVPKLKIDCEIPLTLVNLAFAAAIEKCAPFGVGNQEPTFISRNVYVEDARLVGVDKKHLKLKLHDEANSAVFDAIAFKMGEFYGSLSPEKSIDIAYTVNVDRWNGNSRVQLKLRDIHLQA